MNKAIWLLCFILIINWLCNYRLAQWKIEKIQQASEHIEKKIDKVVEDLEGLLDPLDQIKQQMKDDAAWENAKESLESNSIR